MNYLFYSVASFVLCIFPFCYAEDKPLFMELVVKDNDATIRTFLNSIDELEYEKKAIHLHLDVINKNPCIIDFVTTWCTLHQDQYASIHHEIGCEPSARVKTTYLPTPDIQWIVIIFSDVFLKPYTLRMLTAKDLPIVTPLLRPLPNPNDPFRNFYLSATESGYYKDHPDYFNVAERKKIGTFRADCVHSMYLIQENYAYLLDSENDEPLGDFISFSNRARKNHVPQFICNEKEFGFFIHFDGSPRDLNLPSLNQVISRNKIKELSYAYYDHDPLLQEYQDNFSINDYALYPVKDALYWVEETWDFIKSCYIKKGLPWEPHIEQLFKQYVKEGDTAIDMGGHIGIHTIGLSKCVGPTGKVHVFEPRAKLFTELLVNTSMNGCNNVIPHRIALGSKEEMAYINIDPLYEGNEATARISSHGEPVPIGTLDSFNISNVSLIKIDIEGHEIEALKGANATLERNRPVMIVEVLRGPECDERLDFIRSLGYSISHLGNNDYLCIPLKLAHPFKDNPES